MWVGVNKKGFIRCSSDSGDEYSCRLLAQDMNYLGSFLHQLSGEKKGKYSVKVSGN